MLVLFPFQSGYLRGELDLSSKLNILSFKTSKPSVESFKNSKNLGITDFINLSLVPVTFVEYQPNKGCKFIKCNLYRGEINEDKTITWYFSSTVLNTEEKVTGKSDFIYFDYSGGDEYTSGRFLEVHSEDSNSVTGFDYKRNDIRKFIKSKMKNVTKVYGEHKVHNG